MTDVTLPQGDDLVREAWYDAMDELISSIATAEDPRVRIEACRVVLDYTSKFNIGLGENYVPPLRPVRSGGEGDDDDE
jgi:hypothetical protein